MFDFAISQNQRRRPTKRIIASYILSCLIHFCCLLVVIRYPQLLQGGKYHRFHPLSAIANLLGSKTADADEDKNWRTVAVLRGPMMEPSAATLKKYLHDWDKKGSGPAPVRIRWGNEEKALENAPPMPKIRQEPKPTVVLPPPNEGTADSPNGTAGAQPSGGNSADASSGSSTIGQADLNSGKKGTVNLPPPGPAPKTDVASNNPPSAIPNGVKSPSNNSNQPSAKVFENERKAIQSPGSGFFDLPKGFALGDYVNLLKACIEGKWEIPSNLKNSQGHTTIVFYIARDGRFTDIRIVDSSGNRSLDLAALKAVVDSKAPALPKGFPGDHVGAKFVLSYNEP